MLLKTRRAYASALKSAQTYDEWLAAAEALDTYRGVDRWRSRSESRRYDYQLIRRRLDRLRRYRTAGNVAALLRDLEEGLHGNVGGIGQASLYRVAMGGTKTLIAEYVDEVVQALCSIHEAESDLIADDLKADFFNRAHRCFGRSALMLSASGSLLHFHFGVARALFTEGLLPRILSGSSGGSIAGSMIATRTDDEIAEVLDVEHIVNLWGSADEILNSSDREHRIAEGLQYAVPDLTFREALDRSGRYLNISIAPVDRHQRSRLLSAVTSPDVSIHSAIRASSAVPGYFSPVELLAREHSGEWQPFLEGEYWRDGGVSDDLPAKRLGRLYAVNHTIVSQANPAIASIATHSDRSDNMLSVLLNGNYRVQREILNTFANALAATRYGSEALKGANSTILAIVNQEYVGDVNIVAKRIKINPLRVLSHSNEREIRYLFQLGERSAWPKIEMIRLQTRISRLLDSLGISSDLDGSTLTPN